MLGEETKAWRSQEPYSGTPAPFCLSTALQSRRQGMLAPTVWLQKKNLEHSVKLLKLAVIFKELLPKEDLKLERIIAYYSHYH